MSTTDVRKNKSHTLSVLVLALMLSVAAIAAISSITAYRTIKITQEAVNILNEQAKYNDGLIEELAILRAEKAMMQEQNHQCGDDEIITIQPALHYY